MSPKDPQPNPADEEPEESDTEITVPLHSAPAAASDACLIQIYPTGPGMGRRFPLSQRSQVIGREPECDIPVDDPSVSRRHASIQPQGAGYTIVDLQSTNGTFINDAVVNSARPLRDGDYVRIGNGIFRYLAGGNVESEYHEEIYRLTIMDGLTDTFNKRYLVDALEQELSRSARFGRPLALLMMDLDLFKSINDVIGHLGGDWTLRELASRMKKHIRKEEVFARYGGEEFALVLVEAGREEALATAERLRRLVAAQPFQFEETPYQVTISIGVAYTTGHETLTAAELIQQADEKLYQAKHAGRNRVVG